MSTPHRAAALALVAMSTTSLFACAPAKPQGASPRPYPFAANIVALAHDNQDYRRVLHTGARTQTVAMSIPPGGDIGEEQHNRVEQILVCVEGAATAIIDGRRVPFRPGDIVVVPPGTRHNFVNESNSTLKLYTIYSPPNHIPGRVQHTKADAEKDVKDEEYGRRVEAGETP
jgi:mannose-6-phosphate isomerase-like protein (cupin superfamily)